MDIKLIIDKYNFILLKYIFWNIKNFLQKNGLILIIILVVVIKQKNLWM